MRPKIKENNTQNKKDEQRFFDAFGENNSYDVFDAGGYNRIINEFLKYFEPVPGLKVADIGCGTGSFTSKFLKYKFKLFGIDISPNCVKYAAKRYPNISFEVGDAERTNYPSQTFDVIFLSGVLHHFRDFFHVIGECHRILKKGGILLCYDPNRQNPFMRVFRCKDSTLYVSKGVTRNERPLVKKEITSALIAGGFSEYKVYSISGVTFRYLGHKASFLILPVYNLIEKIMDIRPLRERFGSFLITYAKKTPV